MGSGVWFKTIISRKKTKQDQLKQVKGTSSQQSNGFKWRNQFHRKSNKLYNGGSRGNPDCGSMSIEDLAAIRIQTAFRAFRARKNVHFLKGIQRLQVLSQGHSVKKQASTTLTYLQSWSKIQAQIRARRNCMVTEGRIRQKKHDNQLKLEAKLHDLQVEWCGGSETMGEIIARIQQREEAAIKRERTMAYAFSHQWRAHPALNQGPFVYECGKGNWGWSWMDRWIAARPWETRLPTHSVIPKKAQTKVASKVGKSTNPSAEKAPDSVKPASTDGKGSTKSSSQSNDEKLVNRDQNAKAVTSHQKTKNARTQQEQHLPSQTSEITG